VSEDTSTVVLEAVSNQLPVVCFDVCGMATVIDETVGRKITLSSPIQSVKDFAKVLNELEADRSLLKQLSLNCRQRQEELSWDNKVNRCWNCINHAFHRIVIRLMRAKK
jgi:Glycosyltransferase